jgi:outer membrane protein OmpA-like peptidoglycan-associated protein
MGCGRRVKSSSVTSSGLCDTELGIKFAKMSDSFFKPGVNLSLLIPTGKDEFSSGRTTAGILAAATFDFKGLKSEIPLRLNANAGYNYSGKKDSDFVPIGVSLELASRLFTPIIEITSEQNLSDSLGWKESPLRFTQGIKATPKRWLCVVAGYDINLAQETERNVKAETFDWRVFFSLTLARSLSGLGAQPGGIFGVVKDKDTGSPIAAAVSITGSDLKTFADPGTGQYSIKGLKSGFISLTVEAEGYKKRVVPAVVKQGETLQRDVDLSAAAKRSWARVSVMDRITGKPVAAIIRFDDGGRGEPSADSSGNPIKLEIAPGKHVVLAEAEGYARSQTEFSVEANQTKEILVSLLKTGEPLFLAGVNFVPTTANLKIESDEGIKEAVDLIKSNPQSRFEIGGHVDTGSAKADAALSEKRASVFARLLVNGYDIDSDNLVAKGYGHSKPIADGSTEEGRLKNTRIEIKALE